VNDAPFNPYRPPRGEVFDIPEADERMERPRQVFIAVALLWVMLVVQAAGLAFMWRLYRIMPPEFLIFAGITTALWVLNAWIVAMIERGKNWARITYLVLFLLGAPIVLFSLAYTLRTSPIAAGSSIVQMLLQIAALIMLFIPPAGAWFRGAAPE